MFRPFLAALTFIVVSFSSGALVADEIKATPDLLQVTEAITSFQQAPLSGKGISAANVILAFAESSDQVEVELYPPVFPWLGTEHYPPLSDVLTTAYVAGSIQDQLANDRKGDTTMPGVLMTLRVYEKIKATHSDYSLPVMETLKEAEAEGKLRELLQLPTE